MNHTFLFNKYREDRCQNCLRASKCNPSDVDILLCSINNYYKGADDVNLPSQEEREELEQET
jgi:hypothetical protein